MDKNICVPLQFSVGNGVNGIVITGPNTGGKNRGLENSSSELYDGSVWASRNLQTGRNLYEQ